ncbi:SIR2 family protein [Marinilactibacillus sp. XAAS-LB27]|uniref:SIR2 family NAD-dependent protein deacylase n=1 Tax=Marinilactibacillus sp. XAAS-LB27 TaxID=3114538 RepID=UPI002E19F062|nr:SIR2 family protein [Marinilactibacillus sp. XAAS-LB27]
MTEIQKRLIKQINNGVVVPFVGAGYSRYYGYPSWNELLSKTAKKIGVEDLEYDDLGKGDPLQIAQSLLHHYKTENYKEKKESIIMEIGMEGPDTSELPTNELLSKVIEGEIQDRLENDFSRKVLEEVHISEHRKDNEAIKKLDKLSKLEISHVLTTNYEEVMEKIFPQHKVLSPGTNRELTWNDSEKSIIKIHGDKNSPEGIIFTHSQFYKFIHDFGYFRSKLYTLFSSNVILMMGYGFNDLTIHQTYFQFIRDYSDELREDKFYMVLTAYDKEKWGTYYEYYIKFLNSYKINVIETVDLPSFIDQLVDEAEIERASTDISGQFEHQDKDSGEFTKALLSIFKSEDEKWYISDDAYLNKNVLEALIKIYKGPYILKGKPFNLENENSNNPDHEYGLKIFDYATELVNSTNSLIKTRDFVKLTNLSLDFINHTNDFYWIDSRLERFLNLSNLLNEEYLEADLEIGKLLYDVLEKCHPRRYMTSNPAGRTLLDRIKDISTYHMSSYFAYIETISDNVWGIGTVNLYWLEVIKEHCEYTFDIPWDKIENTI